MATIESPEKVGLKPAHEFDQAQETWPRGDRPAAIREAASEFRARFAKITWPGVTARLRPTSKASSSVIEMRPLPRSATRLRMPAVMLAPCVCSAVLMNSGLVATKFEGAMASMNWRVKNFSRSRAAASSTGTASISLSRKSAFTR